MDLNTKKILFAGWGCENKADTYMYQIWTHTLKNIFKNLITFDTKKNYFQYGKEIMNKNLLKTIEIEKPDYIIMAFFNDEFYLETLEKIKKISPKIKTILISCDEDLKYDNFYKFISLFFDYHIVSQKQVISKYKKDEIKNIFYHPDFNTYMLKPLGIEKKYDVTFIGRPKADRAELLEYLIDNGIKVNIFGWDWYSYPKLRNFYNGFLNAEGYNKVINQSKINLCLTKAGYSEEKGLYNLKGKAFEVAQTNSFQLIEYFPAFFKFFKKDEVGTFTDKKELLEKVKYYLKNEKERETMAKKSYKKIIEKYDREKYLKKIFNIIFTKKSFEQDLPKINEKIITLSKEDINQNLENLNNHINNYDYICFNDGKCIISSYRNYIQAYSLKKSDAKISCCDYYNYSKSLGNYLLFRGDWAFRRIGKDFYRLLDINQLMIKKDFFLKNIESFKKLFKNEEFNLINKRSTIFVSIPLIQIEKLKTVKYEDMVKAFEMRFIDKLVTLIHKHNILSSQYIYIIFIQALLGKPFLLKYLLKSLFNKNNWDKLILNRKYLDSSLLKMLIKRF